MKNDVAGPDATPLDRLLGERIALCWLQAKYAEAIYAKRMASLTLDQGEYLQKRQDRAHWRLLTAIKTLAQVRKLGVPALQLNIAEKQVNVITTDGPNPE